MFLRDGRNGWKRRPALGTAHRNLVFPTDPSSFLPAAVGKPGDFVFCIPYPWVPEQLGEYHQVGRGEGEAHVGSGDGQHGHSMPLGQLELLAQVVSICRGGGAIDADVLHLLQGWEEVSGAASRFLKGPVIATLKNH